MPTPLNPSRPPVRYPSGVSTDWKWGPMSQYGAPAPMRWHTWFDDFDNIHAAYTSTRTGNGTIATAASNGGNALFTTNTSTPAATDIANLQLAPASFGIVLGRKFVFGVRLQLSTISAAAFRTGVINTTTAPFTGGQITDGIYFDKPAGGIALTINLAVAGAVQSVTIPTSAYALTNATQVDLAFEYTPKGAVLAWVGAQIFGWIPESGSAPTGITNRGFVARIFNTTQLVPATNLAPFVGMASGTTASSTASVDFLFAAAER